MISRMVAVARNFAMTICVTFSGLESSKVSVPFLRSSENVRMVSSGSRKMK